MYKINQDKIDLFSKNLLNQNTQESSSVTPASRENCSKTLGPSLIAVRVNYEATNKYGFISSNDTVENHISTFSSYQETTTEAEYDYIDDETEFDAKQREQSVNYKENSQIIKAKDLFQTHSVFDKPLGVNDTPAIVTNSKENLIRSLTHIKSSAGSESTIFPLSTPYEDNSTSQFINIDTEVHYKYINDDFELNAKKYVYLGALNKGMALQQGLTLDSQGNLQLIKSKFKDLIKTHYSRLKKSHYFYISTLDLKQYANIKFDDLKLNEQGQLIAKQKGEEKYYMIVFEPVNTAIDFYFDENIEPEIPIKLNLYQLHDNLIKDDELSFNVSNKKIKYRISFYFKDGKLCLKELQIGENKYNYEYSKHTINFFLKYNVTILSIKKQLT